jgi:hypothetical protein
MKRFRGIILIASAVIAVALPLTELGFLAMHLFLPLLLGVVLAWFFTDKTLAARSVLLCSVVVGIALARICWIAMVLDGGNWRFDGEWDLVIMSVVFQVFFAAIAFTGITMWLKSWHGKIRETVEVHENLR